MTNKAKAIAALSKAKKGLTADRLASVVYGKGATYKDKAAGLSGILLGIKVDGLKLQKSGRGSAAVFSL